MWFLQARRGLLFTIINHNHIDPNWFFLHSARRGLRGHPYKVRQGARHRRRRGSAFSVRVLKYWNALSASVVAAPSVNASIKAFPHLLHWLITHTPQFTYLPPLSICTPSINKYHLYMLPNSLLYICGFFRPVMAYFLPLAIIISNIPLCHSLLFVTTWQSILLGNLLGHSHNTSCLRYIFAFPGKTNFKNPCSFLNRFEHGNLVLILNFNTVAGRTFRGIPF